MERNIYKIGKELFITNDEEIKERNYVFNEVSNEVYRITILNELVNYEKKVILTTDSNLIKDGVQEIDDEFLEWFVKNTSCEFVNAYFYKGIETGHYYRIDIPKEEPKQETLEEAAEKYSKQFDYAEDSDAYTDFINGAKWQQQQNKNLYSEEEVRNLLIECCGEVSCEDGALIGKSPAELVEWIDTKFKKK